MRDIRLFDVVVERIAGLFPAVEAAAQWAHAGDAELVELHGDLRAGLLGWAGAVEDDVAIARDLIRHGFEFGGADAHGAGQDARIGQIVERMAEVDDVGVALGDAAGGGPVDHSLDFGGLDTQLADLGDELTLLDDAPEEEANHHQNKEQRGEVAEQAEEQ